MKLSPNLKEDLSQRVRLVKMSRFKTLQFFFVLIVTGSVLAGAGLTYGLLLLMLRVGRMSMPAAVALTAVIVCVTEGTVIALVVSLRVSRPMSRVTEAARLAAAGDFSAQVEVRHTYGEMRALIESVNHMNRELSGTEMFRKDFVNNFSHEFKTPIVSIRGFASQLMREDLTDAQRGEYAALIVQESDRLTGMASNVLTLTRLENQTIVGEKSAFSLDEQLRDCILLLQREWEKKELELDVELSPVTYYGNEKMLAQVWSNLLGNAVKFTGQCGEIAVSCAREGAFAVVRVRDNGIGMSEETRAHIFERFYQGDAAHSGAGNGLGLPIARRIVELCGGTIDAESTLGRGTEMTVRLPLT